MLSAVPTQREDKVPPQRARHRPSKQKNAVDIENYLCLWLLLLHILDFLFFYREMSRKRMQTEEFVYMALKKLLEWERNNFCVKLLS